MDKIDKKKKLFNTFKDSCENLKSEYGINDRINYCYVNKGDNYLDWRLEKQQKCTVKIMLDRTGISDLHWHKQVFIFLSKEVKLTPKKIKDLAEESILTLDVKLKSFDTFMEKLEF
jgi:hypothetical protein